MTPIFKPFMPDGIISQVEKILYSPNLAFGQYGRMFEEKLSAYIGNDQTLTVSSYNQALLIVLSTLGLKAGDEIIASPVSCLASNQPFAVKGLKINWVDVDPLTGAMCLDDLKRKMSNNIKAIFHNHYCGYLGRINEVNNLAKEFGVPVIDDCIEAFGSEYNNQKMGNVGTDITVFSFQTVRLPNTIDGGAIVFKDKILFEKAKLVRDYGIERSSFRDSLNEISENCDIRIEGYGGLMSELNSSIGCFQMNHVEKLITLQRDNAAKWDDIVGRADVKSLNCVSGSKPNYWVYGVLGSNKVETIKRFRNEGFYATGVHINNNIYSVFNNREQLKGVNEFISKFVALPSGWWIKSDDIKL